MATKKLKRKGKVTSVWGVQVELDCEILCAKCYRGKAGPYELNWETRHTAEVDSPEHCYQCGVLLPNQLTPEGIDYLKEKLENGNMEDVVLKLWQREFRHVLEANP